MKVSAYFINKNNENAFKYFVFMLMWNVCLQKNSRGAVAEGFSALDLCSDV